MQTYSELDHCYGSNGFFGEDTDGEDLVGCRTPNCNLEINSVTKNIFSHLKGPYFHILVFTEYGTEHMKKILQEMEEKLTGIQEICHIHTLYKTEKNLNAYKKFDIQGEGIVIIRPDGYIYDWIDTLDIEMIRDFREHCLGNT